MPFCCSKVEQVTTEDLVELSEIEKHNLGFKKLAESITTLLSRIRLNADHDESDTIYKFIPRLGLESVRLR
ncbi:hypothetical protein CK203_095849 [Vitis vinifera]|uniref:Uncharacterized protein n=1 Tax=Vitis vinifera TaxID=29760 RepID=A0A438CK92_VITVI|nr:hypothetical protein CK203_095849 [Vitis vinifera]